VGVGCPAVIGLTAAAPHPCGAPLGLVLESLRCSVRNKGALPHPTLFFLRTGSALR
jgi:hypothetical protein